MRRRSNAFTYAVYGALFGAAFPLLSTLLYAKSELGSVSEVWRAQRTISLLWVIDTAPAFLGVVAWLAGRRQDAVESLLARLGAASRELERTNHALAINNDELEQANAKLVDASRLKSQFLANVSHELRTPLNAVIGFSRIVLKKTASMIPEPQAKNLQTIHDSGKHLLDMVNDLLDIERIEAGMLRVSFATVNLASILTDVVTALAPAAAEKGLTLECVPGPVPLNVRTDAGRLRQVLDNLTSNAIKYSDAGTIRVRVELRPADAPDELRLVVEDEGLGIPEEQLAKIFDAFHQVDGSSTRAQGGVGLGLHLVRRLVSLLEGAIRVDSTLGKGSTFRVVFPASIIEATQPDVAAQHPLAPVGSGPLVLVIDDQVEAIEILSNELVEAGFRVVSATSGEGGLAKAAAVRPAVILLDIVMPDLDGWAVLERLRTDPELSSTPVLVTSMLDETPRARDLEIAGWLTKPIEPAHFLSAFRGLGIGAADDLIAVERSHR